MSNSSWRQVVSSLLFHRSYQFNSISPKLIEFCFYNNLKSSHRCQQNSLQVAKCLLWIFCRFRQFQRVHFLSSQQEFHLDLEILHFLILIRLLGRFLKLLLDLLFNFSLQFYPTPIANLPKPFFDGNPDNFCESFRTRIKLKFHSAPRKLKFLKILPVVYLYNKGAIQSNQNLSIFSHFIIHLIIKSQNSAQLISRILGPLEHLTGCSPQGPQGPVFCIKFKCAIIL